MTLTALVKLSDRFEGRYNDRIDQMLAPFKTSCMLQGQQRACEYSELLHSDYDMIRESLLDRMPPLDIDNAKARRAEEEQGDEDEDLKDYDDEQDDLYAWLLSNNWLAFNNLLDLPDLLLNLL